jgi:hypothetical protein
MTPGEKAQALQWLARDIGGAFPGIESTPGVAGGEPCIVRTRIPVWVLVQACKLGSSARQICYEHILPYALKTWPMPGPIIVPMLQKLINRFSKMKWRKLCLT